MCERDGERGQAREGKACRQVCKREFDSMQNKCGSISCDPFFYSFRWLSHFNSYFAMFLIYKHTHICHLFLLLSTKRKKEWISFLNNFLKLTRRMWVKCIIEQSFFLAFFSLCTAMCVIFVWKSAEMGMCVRNKRITEKSTIYEEKRNQVLQTSKISGSDGNSSPRVETFFFFLIISI